MITLKLNKNDLEHMNDLQMFEDINHMNDWLKHNTKSFTINDDFLSFIVNDKEITGQIIYDNDIINIINNFDIDIPINYINDIKTVLLYLQNLNMDKYKLLYYEKSILSLININI